MDNENIELKVPSGILVIDKPSGITSHDVVDVIRKIYKDVKVGHTGTLDPMATGVMNICIGEATKLSDYLICDEKTYIAQMLLGVKTDTYDITGRTISASPVIKDEIYIKERIKRFVGKSLQTPPIYSAIKINGKKAYEYARNDEKVEMEPREVEIFDISNIEVDLNNNLVSFKVRCSKGTYIRSLINDIGEKIGCGATMTSLRRVANGISNEQDSIPLYEYLKLPLDLMIEKIINLEDFYKGNKSMYLNDIEYKRYINGVALDIETNQKIVKVYYNKQFVGLRKS